MRVGSVFAGIGGFDLAFERAGFTVSWQIEINEFCLRVLEKRFPHVPKYGDVRKVTGRELTPVEILVGGFPCQDVSIANKSRKGLSGEHSSLWWEFHRLLVELRPVWCLVENVTGILSSHNGQDMEVLLRSLGNLGYWWAYRVLDAQWFGLPQRRKRVFIVGNLRDRYAPAKVLFERESCKRHTQTRRKEEETVTVLVGRSLEVTCKKLADTLVAHYAKGPMTSGRDSTVRNVVVHSCNGLTFVRKLTPLECERLQGFPDGWTCLCGAIKTHLCTCPDRSRYSALGNAVAVPVAEWIARRIWSVACGKEE